MAKDNTKFIKGIEIKEESSLDNKVLEITVDATAVANKKAILKSAHQDDRTITLPDATDTLVGKATTDVLTNKSIDDDNNVITNLALTAIKTEVGQADKFLSRDGSGVVIDTKAVPVGDVIGSSDTQSLTNKTIDGTDATGTNVVKNDATDVSYDNTTSLMASVTVQAAVDEIESRVDTAENDISNLETLSGSPGLTSHASFTGTTIPDSSTTKDALQALETSLETKIDSSEKGAANGVASLDGTSKLPVAQLPTSAMLFLGNWDASGNSPSLVDGVGTQGDTYRVSTVGSQDLGSGSLPYQAGDWVYYDGAIWQKGYMGSGGGGGGSFTPQIATILNNQTAVPVSGLLVDGNVSKSFSLEYNVDRIAGAVSYDELTTFSNNAVINAAMSAFGNTVNSVLVQPDGKILVGGSFTSYKGDASRAKLIRLNSDGTLDTGFDSLKTLLVDLSDGEVLSLSLDSSNRILVGGSTSTPLLRLLANGSRDPSFLTLIHNEWELRATPVDNTWRSVVYGNGLFVAVGTGSGNLIMTSPDGITWTGRTPSASNLWVSVTYGNGLFVAVSNNGVGNRVMTSPDGITWTSRTSAADNFWTRVTYGNGLFVAVSNTGVGNRVMTSPNGITWTIRTSVADNGWEGVTYGNGLFVAVSNNGVGNRVMTSPDGITWTSRTSASDNSWSYVAYGNGLFVAVSATGAGNRVMTSPDGITWTSRTSAADNSWASVTYGNGLFVAVSNTGLYRVMTSYDGITWITGITTLNISWLGVAYGNGLFVAVGTTGIGYRAMTLLPYLSYGAKVNSVKANNDDTVLVGGNFTTVHNDLRGKFVKLSPTGAIDPSFDRMRNETTTWAPRTAPVNNSWSSVAYGNGLFVAVSATGAGNRVMTSPDGITWTSRTTPVDNEWRSVTYGKGLFVAVSSTGTGNRVMTSPDGITWTIRTSASDNDWRGVAFGNGAFVAVSSDGAGTRVMRSSNGTSWSSISTPNSYIFYSVTFGNGLFVATAVDGLGDRVMTSLDGITWTSMTSAADNGWASVTYGKGLFVAVSYDGVGNRVMTSPDGITWTSRTSAADNGWVSVTYGNGLFVAVSYDGGSNRVMTSPDGITWTLRTSVAWQWGGVAYGNGLFVAVGAGGQVQTSPYTTFITGNEVIAIDTTTTPSNRIAIGGAFVYDNFAAITGGTNFIELTSTGAPTAASTSGQPVFNNTVNTVVYDTSDDLIVGGKFTQYQFGPTGYLAKLNTSLVKNATFDTNTSSKFNNEVVSLGIHSTTILVGGKFTDYDSVAGRSYLTSLNANGTINTQTDSTTINGGTPKFSSQIKSIKSISATEFIVGGNFINYDSTPGDSYLLKAISPPIYQQIEAGSIRGLYSSVSATWSIVNPDIVSDAGIVFSIDSAGQIKYTTTLMAGSPYSGQMKYIFTSLLVV